MASDPAAGRDLGADHVYTGRELAGARGVAGGFGRILRGAWVMGLGS